MNRDKSLGDEANGLCYARARKCLKDIAMKRTIIKSIGCQKSRHKRRLAPFSVVPLLILARRAFRKI